MANGTQDCLFDGDAVPGAGLGSVGTPLPLLPLEQLMKTEGRSLWVFVHNQPGIGSLNEPKQLPDGKFI